MSVAVGVFARAPIPGETKTRLAASLGPRGDERAAALHEAFLADVLERAMGVGAVTLFVAGDLRHPAFERTAPPRVRRAAQVDGDLGARMAAAMAELLADHPRALVIGSDAPTLPSRIVRAAAAHPSPVVLTPAADGGFVLIGGRRVPALESIRWSAPTTLAETRARNPAAGLTEPWYDIDDAEDLQLLVQHLALDPAAAPRTAARLRQLLG